MFRVFQRLRAVGRFYSVSGTVKSFIRQNKNAWAGRSLVTAFVSIPIVNTLLPLDNKCFLFNDKNRCERMCRICCSGKIADLKRLIQEGNDVNCRHFFGWTPLHAAVANGKLEYVKILLENGADVNAQEEFPGILRLSSRFKIQPHHAAETRMRDFGSTLSLNGDFTGFTPLHYAVFLQHNDIIQLLLRKGADVTMENIHGQTPFDMALTDQTKVLLMEAHQKALEGKRKRDQEERRRNPLEKRLKEVIVGQEEAINSVGSAIRMRESGWTRGDKPLVFLFLGSSGVGKTELSKRLAEYLFKDDKRCFIRVDMSEYQNQHEVSKFIGAPPGYVGYDQGGQLTARLKACPNAVVLFDEIEKAHPDIITIMLQLFDEGRLTDGQGQTISCPNAIFVMTSNLASEEIARHATKLRMKKPETEPGTITISKQFKDTVMYPILKTHFMRDEFLGRITDMVYFLPFNRSEMSKLVDIELKFWMQQAQDNHKINITWEPDVLDVLSDSYDIHYGARSLKHAVEKKVITHIAKLSDDGKLEDGASLHLSVNYGSESQPLQQPEILFDISPKRKAMGWFSN